MARMTRQESQAQTRSCLLAAAAKVLARKGLQRASIDEVAVEAGYTKGAFYANFKSKEELFLAMLDERFAERIEAVDRVLGGDGPLEERARAAGTDFDRAGLADPEWSRLFFEFAAYAARDPAFREELLTRYRALRHSMAELHRRAVAADDGHAAKTAEEHEQLALMLCAMANGAALEHLLDPEDAPEDLYGQMVEIFVLGLRAHAQVPSGT